MRLKVDAADLTHDSDEAQAAFEQSRRRRRRFWLGLAILLVGAPSCVLLTTVLPTRIIDRAHKAQIACVNRLYETGQGDPSECATAGRWLWYPKLIPWRRSRAKKEEVEIRYSVASHALMAATSRDLDADARNRAATELVKLLAGSPAPETFFNAFGTLRQHGAYDALARLADYAASDGERSIALKAALIRGDLDALRTAATSHGKSVEDADFHLARGAALCLLGDREAGRAALVESDHYYRTSVQPPGSLDARLAILACGAPEASLGLQPMLAEPYSREPLRHSLIALGKDVRWLPEAHDLTYAESDVRMMRLAYLLQKDQLETEAALRIIFPQEGRGLIGPDYSQHFTAWTLLRAPYVDAPDLFEATASRLVELAANAPEKRVDPRDDDELMLDTVAHPLARTQPRTYLEFGAWALLLDAAAGYIRRGEQMHALAVIEQAVPLVDANFEIMTVASRHAAGDVDGALGVFETLVHAEEATKAPYDAVAELFLQKATVLAAAGRFDEAYEAAKIAHDRARAIPPGRMRYERVAARWLGAATAWMRVAMALRTGNGTDEIPGLPEAPTHVELGTDADLVVAYWRRLALLANEEKPVARWHAAEQGLHFEAQSVLPAVIYVASRACSDGDDVEVWLDRVLRAELLGNVRHVLAARAEAARWRGDQEAARDFDSRLAALQSLIDDAATAELAKAAGI